jgi:predicted transcriptional regulator
VKKTDEKRQAEFTKYLNEVFIRQFMLRNRRYTVTDFAEWAGTTQPSMSRYLSGKLMPDEKNTLNMARVMPKIMDIMEYPKDSILRKVLSVYYTLPEENRQSVLERIKELEL